MEALILAMGGLTLWLLWDGRRATSVYADSPSSDLHPNPTCVIILRIMTLAVKKQSLAISKVIYCIYTAPCLGIPLPKSILLNPLPAQDSINAQVSTSRLWSISHTCPRETH